MRIEPYFRCRLCGHEWYGECLVNLGGYYIQIKEWQEIHPRRKREIEKELELCPKCDSDMRGIGELIAYRKAEDHPHGQYVHN